MFPLIPKAPGLFERRGTDICISLDSSGEHEWVNYARWMPTKRYVKVGRHILRWDEFEVIMQDARLL